MKFLIHSVLSFGLLLSLSTGCSSNSIAENATEDTSDSSVTEKSRKTNSTVIETSENSKPESSDESISDSSSTVEKHIATTNLAKKVSDKTTVQSNTTQSPSNKPIVVNQNGLQQQIDQLFNTDQQTRADEKDLKAYIRSNPHRPLRSLRDKIESYENSYLYFDPGSPSYYAVRSASFKLDLAHRRCDKYPYLDLDNFTVQSSIDGMWTHIDTKKYNGIPFRISMEPGNRLIAVIQIASDVEPSQLASAAELAAKEVIEKNYDSNTVPYEGRIVCPGVKGKVFKP